MSVGNLQAALAALTEVPSLWLEERLQELEAKRNLAYRLLADIPHVRCPRPNGAFYLLPDVSHYYGLSTVSGGVTIKDSDDLCLELLKTEQVALVAGDAFGAPSCIRVSYAASVDLIDESLLRLKRFLTEGLL